MKIKQTMLAIALAIGVGSTLFGSAAFAVTCGGEVLKDGQSCCGGVVTSVISCDQTGSCPGGEDPYEGVNPGSDQTKIDAYADKYKHKYGLCVGDKLPDNNMESSGLWGLLITAINILTVGVGIAAVGGVLYGSIMYASAGGSVEQTKKAKGAIINVIVGLVAYALMYSFLNFIIPGGVFS
jgi:hypothetical protein